MNFFCIGPEEAPEHAYHLLQNLLPERRVCCSIPELVGIFTRLTIFHSWTISFPSVPVTPQRRKVPVTVSRCAACDCSLQPLASHDAVALTYAHGCETISFDIARCPRCFYYFAGCWKVQRFLFVRCSLMYAFLFYFRHPQKRVATSHQHLIQACVI